MQFQRFMKYNNNFFFFKLAIKTIYFSGILKEKNVFFSLSLMFPLKIRIQDKNYTKVGHIWFLVRSAKSEGHEDF